MRRRPAASHLVTVVAGKNLPRTNTHTHTHTHTHRHRHRHTHTLPHTHTLTERRRHKKAQTQIQMLTLHYKSDLCSGKLPLFESCSHARTHARKHAPQARTHARTHAAPTDRQTDRQTPWPWKQKGCCCAPVRARRESVTERRQAETSQSYTPKQGSPRP